MRAALLALFVLAGCGAPAGSTDGGTGGTGVDGGGGELTDGGPADAGSMDAGDAGSMDAGDAGSMDAGDAGSMDAGLGPFTWTQANAFTYAPLQFVAGLDTDHVFAHEVAPGVSAYVSTDRGLTWPGLAAGNGGYSNFFAGPGIFGLEGGGTVNFTEDGETWMYLNVTSGGSCYYPDNIWAANRNSLYSFRPSTSPQSLCHSTDEGATWTPVGDLGGKAAYFMPMSRENDIWIVGSAGLLHYDGSTITSSPISSPGPVLPNNVNYPVYGGASIDDLYFVGDTQHIYHSKDRGMTWTLQVTDKPGAPSALNALIAFSPTEIYAFGNGVIARNDGTSNQWKTESFSVPGVIYSAWASDAHHVFAVGKSNQGGNLGLIIVGTR